MNREELFNSQSESDLRALWRSFSTVEEMESWIQSRPHSPIDVRESIVGSPEIVVVIPTADHEGRYASIHRRNMLPYVGVITVQSNGPGFSFARSVNEGIRRAMETDAEWIGIINDDTIFYHTTPAWSRQVEKNLTEWCTMREYVFARGASPPYWSFVNIDPDALLYRTFLRMRPQTQGFYRTFIESCARFGLPALKGNSHSLHLAQLYLRRFRVDAPRFLHTQPVVFMKRDVIRDPLLDERFVNGNEDSDLSVSLASRGYQGQILRCSVTTQFSPSLGNGTLRWLRYGLPSALSFANKYRRLAEDPSHLVV